MITLLGVCVCVCADGTILYTCTLSILEIMSGGGGGGTCSSFTPTIQAFIQSDTHKIVMNS